MCDNIIMKNPLETTTKTPTGWLVIREISPNKDEGDRHRVYVEKCQDEYKRLREILHTNNKLRDYIMEIYTKPPSHYKKDNGKIDIDAYFRENWELVDIKDCYKTYAKGVEIGKYTVSEALGFIHQDIFRNDINIEAIISSSKNKSLTLYQLKRKFKKKDKVPCPHCGKLQSRCNLARHKRQNCKVLKQQSS